MSYMTLAVVVLLAVVSSTSARKLEWAGRTNAFDHIRNWKDNQPFGSGSRDAATAPKSIVWAARDSVTTYVRPAEYSVGTGFRFTQNARMVFSGTTGPTGRTVRVVFSEGNMGDPAVFRAGIVDASDPDEVQASDFSCHLNWNTRGAANDMSQLTQPGPCVGDDAIFPSDDTAYVQVSDAPQRIGSLMRGDKKLTCDASGAFADELGNVLDTPASCASSFTFGGVPAQGEFCHSSCATGSLRVQQDKDARDAAQTASDEYNSRFTDDVTANFRYNVPFKSLQVTPAAVAASIDNIDLVDVGMKLATAVGVADSAASFTQVTGVNGAISVIGSVTAPRSFFVGVTTASPESIKTPLQLPQTVLGVPPKSNLEAAVLLVLSRALADAAADTQFASQTTAAFNTVSLKKWHGERLMLEVSRPRRDLQIMVDDDNKRALADAMSMALKNFADIGGTSDFTFTLDNSGNTLGLSFRAWLFCGNCKITTDTRRRNLVIQRLAAVVNGFEMTLPECYSLEEDTYQIDPCMRNLVTRVFTAVAKTGTMAQAEEDARQAMDPAIGKPDDSGDPETVLSQALAAAKCALKAAEKECYSCNGATGSYSDLCLTRIAHAAFVAARDAGEPDETSSDRARFAIEAEMDEDAAGNVARIDRLVQDAKAENSFDCTYDQDNCLDCNTVDGKCMACNPDTGSVLYDGRCVETCPFGYKAAANNKCIVDQPATTTGGPGGPAEASTNNNNAASGGLGGGAAAGIAIGVVFLVAAVFAAFVIVRRRRGASGGSGAGASGGAGGKVRDSTMVSFENPMYVDGLGGDAAAGAYSEPGDFAAAGEESGYQDVTPGMGVYDMPNSEDGGAEVSDGYMSVQGVGGGAETFSMPDSFNDALGEGGGGYMDVAPVMPDEEI